MIFTLILTELSLQFKKGVWKFFNVYDGGGDEKG